MVRGTLRGFMEVAHEQRLDGPSLSSRRELERVGRRVATGGGGDRPRNQRERARRACSRSAGLRERRPQRCRDRFCLSQRRGDRPARCRSFAQHRPPARQHASFQRFAVRLGSTANVRSASTSRPARVPRGLGLQRRRRRWRKARESRGDCRVVTCVCRNPAEFSRARTIGAGPLRVMRDFLGYACRKTLR